MTSWQQESLQMRVAPICTSTFPCIFSAQSLQVQGSTQMVPCVLLVSSAHHKPSTAGRSNTWKHLDKGREKAANRTFVGFAQARHPHSRQKRGGVPSPGTPHVPASRDA